MAKFVVYEKVSEAVYKRVDKSKTSDGMQTVINLGSGLMAGFAAALVSQPADTMLSKINKTKGLPGEGTTSRLIKIAKELGLRGSYTGIGARLFMVGTLVRIHSLRIIDIVANSPRRQPVNSPFTATSRKRLVSNPHRSNPSVTNKTQAQRAVSRLRNHSSNRRLLQGLFQLHTEALKVSGWILSEQWLAFPFRQCKNIIDRGVGIFNATRILYFLCL